MKKIIERIKKLLRLAARSTNEGEAANALSQAQKLMAKHGLDSHAPELSDVCQADVLSKLKANKPAAYFSRLVWLVAESFGCHVHRADSWDGKHRVVFTGHNERPEVATYVYEVLERQLLKSRKEFLATLNKRLKRTTKTARADMFCEGWVTAVRSKVNALALSDAESTQIKEFQSKKHGELKTLNVRSASEKKARGGADNAFSSGYESGKQAELNHGVNGRESQKLTMK
ncbi:DUF2786 domain-containing protein [Vibrio parahaemolyticus]|nr:DUF2786 domain-containing protein [Vibrio parahaemolyticus]